MATGHPTPNRIVSLPWLLYGILLFCAGIAMFLFGQALVLPVRLFGWTALLPFNEWIVWYSGVPVMAGVLLSLSDILILFRFKRRTGNVRFDPIGNRHVTVVLTAYNDEASIGDAVRDFREHPLVKRVIVVSNNSRDATLARAQEAGATALDEPLPGYGRCVYRCLSEGLRYTDTDFVLLCEGDLTFRAYDIDKFLAYAPHSDIVNGTRIVEQLRDSQTQLSTFIFYGNFFAGKLLEAKHLGKGTFTDVGTMYKLCRATALHELLPRLNPAINLEFNAHFLDTALATNLGMVECPITFHQRVGVSKGGNVNNRRAFMVGMRMIRGLVFGWEEGGAMSGGSYHETRFAPDPRRRTLWGALWRYWFSRQIQPGHCVLDLGCGYGEFINAVVARRRIAVDAWPGFTSHVDPAVEAVVGPVTDLAFLAPASVDFAFASNVFEHLTHAEFGTVLDQLRSKLAPGGTLNILQPNWRYAHREYFDDYTHVAVWSHVGLRDFLEANGYEVLDVRPRFLPLTIKSRLPVTPLMIRLYLASPFKPLGKQMLVKARPR